MSDANKNASQIKRNLLLLGVSGIAGAGLLIAFRITNPDIIGHWKNLFEQAIAYMTAHPWALVPALAILPGIGFPASPLLILFGLILGPRYGMLPTCLIGVATHSACSIWAYFLASGPMRNLLKNTLLKKPALPQLTGVDALRLGFIIRIAPGFPYSIQNIILGVAGMKFRTYLAVSIPTTSIYTIGFIVTGDALFEGQIGLALSGIFLIILTILGIRIFINRTKTKTQSHAG